MMRDPIQRVRFAGAALLLPAIGALVAATAWTLRLPAVPRERILSEPAPTTVAAPQSIEPTLERAAFDRSIWGGPKGGGESTVARAPGFPAESLSPWRYLGLAVAPGGGVRVILHDGQTGDIVKVAANEACGDWHVDSVTTEAVILHHVTDTRRLRVDAMNGDVILLPGADDEETQPDG